MAPICPICGKPMTFLYKDVRRRRSLYKCRNCGYHEEVYEIDGKDPETTDTGDPSDR